MINLQIQSGFKILLSESDQRNGTECKSLKGDLFSHNFLRPLYLLGEESELILLQIRKVNIRKIIRLD